MAAIERQLAAANARLEQLGIQSGIADEAYNGAVYKLQQAKVEAAAAAARATKAQQTLATQRQQIGRFAAASYQGGGDVAKIAPLFTADGPQQLLDSAGAARSVSTAMQGSYLRYTATQVVTNLFKVQADQAVVKVKKATDEAARAKKAAEDAEAAQASAVDRDGRAADAVDRAARRTAEHFDQGGRPAAAGARGACATTSRRHRREEGRRTANAGSPPGRPPSGPGKRPNEPGRRPSRRRRNARNARRRRRITARSRRSSTSRTGPTGTSNSNTNSNSNGHSSGRGASAAIDFALSQLGDMYLWGGTGPSRWDCSGLTMGAWKRAGVQLPHYSVAQYEQIRHIDEDELRPGDLIFWAVNPSDPGTIHHVAMYLGNGRMIHAPRTGQPVQIDSVYYWIPPNFFGRP